MGVIVDQSVNGQIAADRGLISCGQLKTDPRLQDKEVMGRNTVLEILKG